MFRKILHTIIVLCVVLQVFSCVFLGQSYMPEAATAPAPTAQVGPSTGSVL